MALIKCPECAREVSDMATACPACARPLRQAAAAAACATHTIEMTGKGWKLGRAIGGLLLLVGLLSCCGGLVTDSGSGCLFGGATTLLLGLAVSAVARFGAWWHHG